MQPLGASRDDDDRSAHGLVPGAAKNAAQEGERTYLAGHQTHPGDLARNDVRPNVEVGRIVANCADARIPGPWSRIASQKYAAPQALVLRIAELYQGTLERGHAGEPEGRNTCLDAAELPSQRRDGL